MQLFVKYLIVASAYGALQWAATGTARQSARREESGTKQKTVQALSAARGGDFVLWGRGLSIAPYFGRILAGIEDVDDIHILVRYLVNDLVSPFGY